MTVARTFRLAPLILLPALASLAAEPATTRPATKLQSELKVVVDDSAAEDNRLEPEAITEAADRFIAAHESFTLGDLENLKIRSPKGRDVLLQEVANVQVQFHRQSH